jgi:fido (protein-threonine AMPylation protein)
MNDPYVYPETDVLINKAGIRDPAKLEQFERLMTAQRMLQPLTRTPITYAGYKAIHRHLFQDVSDWAGQPRTVDIEIRRLVFRACSVHRCRDDEAVCADQGRKPLAPATP